MRGGLGQCRHECHRCRATADHDNPLAFVVEILGPALRVHDAALVPVHARPAWHITLGVVIVAAAHAKEVAGEPDGLPFGARRVNRPRGIPRRPRRMRDLMAKPNLAVDAIFLSRFRDVFADARTVGDRLSVSPGTKGVAERMHVGIGTYSRVAEQVPGSPDRASAVQNCVGFGRTFRLEVIGRADSGKPCADDEHVEVFHASRISDMQGRDRSSFRHIGHLRDLSYEDESPDQSCRILI